MLAADTRGVNDPSQAASPRGPQRTWKEIVDPVRPFLEQVAIRMAEQVDTFDPEVAGFARYALTNQGKQLRPTLVALSGGTVGRPNDSLVTVAVIIEMVHLATLVHDDVMDEASIRRRQPTVAANWGNPVSVLLGDCLFAHALKLAAGFPTPDVCRAVASATKTVCSGEILQTLRRRLTQVPRAEYFRVIEMKTAELFALSCDLGVWMCGASTSERTALRRFGMQLGTAYQIYDDCLDLYATELAVGKSLGTDLAKGKLTLPLLVALDRADAAARRELLDLLDRWTPDRLPALMQLLDRHHALEESQRVIYGYLDAARDALRPMPPTESRDSLLALTGFLAQQTGSLGV